MHTAVYLWAGHQPEEPAPHAAQRRVPCRQRAGRWAAAGAGLVSELRSTLIFHLGLEFGARDSMRAEPCGRVPFESAYVLAGRPPEMRT